MVERIPLFELDIDMIMGSSRLSFGIFNKRGIIYNSMFFLGICVDKFACQGLGFPHEWLKVRASYVYPTLIGWT